MRSPLSRLVPSDYDRKSSNNFNTIRLVMALAVVWSHSFALYLGSEATEPLSELFGGIYNAGNIAVLAFFVISGFLICQSWDRSSSWRSYLRKRIARIYPGYLVALLICSLVVVPAYSSRGVLDFQPREWMGIASNLLLRNYIVPSDAFDNGPVNGSLWSIPFEFRCYLGVLFLGLTGLFGRRCLFPAAVVIVMLIRVWLDLNGKQPGGGLVETIFGYPYFWFSLFPPFVLGAAVYHYREVIPRSSLLLIALFLAFLLACHLPIAGRGHDILARLILQPALAYAIFYWAFSSVSVGDAARYGDFSYGTYLYAYPIQQMLVWSIKGHVSFATYIIISMVLSLAAGVVSWYAIEHWFLRSKREKTRSVNT
jgi:peptidoglycan/LPS O-acetylase OafA/YrhL